VTRAIGVDVGGTGIKGAVVDVDTGRLVSDRIRMETPQPATPSAVRDAVVDLIDQIGPGLPVGVAVPAVVQHGVVRTAANIDPAWIGTSLPELFAATPGVVAWSNDADAQALAEHAFGSSRGHDGLIVTATFGTGIGVGLIHDGRLVPNAELGHLELDGRVAESFVNARVRETAATGWEAWGALAARYLQHLENLLWPDLIVVGGSVAKRPEKWLEHVPTRTPLRPATLINNAGIVGAAHATATPVDRSAHLQR
jgi:polyphosphate glucokinase